MFSINFGCFCHSSNVEKSWRFKPAFGFSSPWHFPQNRFTSGRISFSYSASEAACSAGGKSKRTPSSGKNKEWFKDLSFTRIPLSVLNYGKDGNFKILVSGHGVKTCLEFWSPFWHSPGGFRVSQLIRLGKSSSEPPFM